MVLTGTPRLWRLLNKKVCVRPMRKRYYVCLQKQKDQAVISSDTTEEEPAPFTANAKWSAFKSPTPPATPKRICARCGILSAPYPRDMDRTSMRTHLPIRIAKIIFQGWTSNVNRLHLSQKERKQKRGAGNQMLQHPERKRRNRYYYDVFLICFLTSVHVFEICHRIIRQTARRRTSLMFVVRCYFLSHRCLSTPSCFY